jgi:prophage antirepressor-like protein
MQKQHQIQLFQSKSIRSVWDEEKQEWYFSVVDAVAVLTDSENPTDYLKKMRKRDAILGDYLGTNCPQIDMVTETGKTRKTLAANPKQLLRIIQSIPSKKAEPFKLWLAQIGSERLDSSQDPELTIELAMKQYKNLGYSDEWINLRLQSIKIRKDLTDEWNKSGVKEGLEYAVLTNLMSKEWSGKNIADYKKLKNLKKESLRDNMTSLELVLNMLAEATTSEIHKNENISGFAQSKIVAKRGASVAKTARIAAEKQTGKPVVSSQNAKSLGNIKKNELPLIYEN